MLLNHIYIYTVVFNMVLPLNCLNLLIKPAKEEKAWKFPDVVKQTQCNIRNKVGRIILQVS